MMLLSWIRWAHILAGATALVSMWIPLLTTKGGRAHRLTGRIYVRAMLALAVTGWIVCGVRLNDADPSNDTFSIFLLFIGTMAAANSLDGVQALRSKHRTSASRNWRDYLPPASLLIAGLALAVWALPKGLWLFVGFSVLGVVSGIGSLRFYAQAPRRPKSWLSHHLSQIGAACIGTVTAFVVVNGGIFGTSVPKWILWIGPGLAGAGLLAWFKRRYQSSSPSP